MSAGKRQSRVEDVYQRLKQEILENRLSPDAQELEPDIAQRLDVSRTPVHEALVRLQADGLVELIPRRGVRILRVSLQDMRDIYEILTVLEPAAAAKVAQTQPQAEALTPLEATTAHMEEALAGGDLDAWARADQSFHRELVELFDNRRSAAIVNNLLDQSHRVRITTLRLREPPRRSTEEHRAILNAIKAGDPLETERLFRAHRVRAAAELVAILEKTRLSNL